MQALANPKPKNILSTSFAYADTVYDTETVFATVQDEAAYVRTPCYLAYPRCRCRPANASEDKTDSGAI